MCIGGNMPAWRQERWNKIDIVNGYVTNLTERDMILVAFLMMRGLTEKEIVKTLGMTEEMFAIVKDRLAFGLLFAGIAVRD